ncbi:MAG: ABC transporter permease [Actinomycetota bacterium]|nr:ABC transporter permease [Actinomycetota bacterium]
MSTPAVIPQRFRKNLEPVGAMYKMTVEAAYFMVSDIVRGRFFFKEFIERSWFLANATALPVILVSIPLGMAIVLQVGGLASQIGATSYVGAADAIGIMREAAPVITALLLAGVGGSAICAEFGARTIREELDALKVMGINPVQRLVAPLLLASIVISLFLNLLVIFVSVCAGYFFNIAILGGSKGSFFGSFTQFATMADFVTAEIKAAVFGSTAAMIAAFKGMQATKGPTAVGEAVNQTVVITGVILFAQNLIITEIFFAVVPQTTF